MQWGLLWLTTTLATLSCVSTQSKAFSIPEVTQVQESNKNILVANVGTTDENNTDTNNIKGSTSNVNISDKDAEIKVHFDHTIRIVSPSLNIASEQVKFSNNDSTESIPEDTIESPEFVEISEDVSDQDGENIDSSRSRSQSDSLGSNQMSDSRADTDIIIETEFGPVKGHEWQESEEIISYLDIPYGKFELFQPPVVPKEWSETRDIHAHEVRCPQYDGGSFVGDLECLTLSIFAPRNAENAKVLFYIHESNTNTGSGDPSIYGPEYLVHKGIILVLPNFRLGALGFLCMLNETVPGNAALKDLTLALAWTSNNIAKFGGDPSNIAVSGDGRSSALAGYLALSNSSKTFVSKVISDSGFVLSHWALDRSPIETAAELEVKIRSAFSDETFEYDLFSNINIEKLITATKDVNFKPCIETSNSTKEPFISNNPWSILTTEKIDLTFLIGSTDHAGLREALQHDSNALEKFNENFSSALPDDLFFEDEATKTEVGEMLKKQYFGKETISPNHLLNLSLFHTDASYLGPDIRVARALIKAGAKVYLYEFSYVGEMNKEFSTLTKNTLPLFNFGAIRGDVAGYLFAQDGRELNEDAEEKKVVEMMNDIWVSFIKNGQPKVEGVTWNQLKESEEDEEDWLSINEKAKAMKGYHQGRLSLWTEIYEKHFVDANFAFRIKADEGVFYITAFVFLNVFNTILNTYCN